MGSMQPGGGYGIDPGALTSMAEDLEPVTAIDTRDDPDSPEDKFEALRELNRLGKSRPALGYRAQIQQHLALQRVTVRRVRIGIGRRGRRRRTSRR